MDIPEGALTWRFVRSGGPGGQNVNKVATKVEVDCDVRACGFEASLTERLVSKLGETVSIAVSETRSQHRNRELALQRLTETLTAAASVPRRRKATRPSKASVERRLVAKRRTSERKQTRGRLPND